MNKAVLVGRLTKEPEVTKVGMDNISHLNFTVAVDRKFKNANGEREADFISCVAWRQTADFIGRYFHKGSRIGLSGSINTRSYEKDGNTVYVTEVFVEDVEFVESASAKPAETAAPTAPVTKIAPEPELPFDF